VRADARLGEHGSGFGVEAQAELHRDCIWERARKVLISASAAGHADASASSRDSSFATTARTRMCGRAQGLYRLPRASTFGERRSLTTGCPSSRLADDSLPPTGSASIAEAQARFQLGIQAHETLRSRGLGARQESESNGCLRDSECR
jgi:hypothetical protein